jgi:hypothetical protein
VDQRLALRDELLAFTVGNVGAADRPVVQQLLRLLAQMLKRGWLDEFPTGIAARTALFQQVRHSCQPPCMHLLIYSCHLLNALLRHTQKSRSQATQMVAAEDVAVQTLASQMLLAFTDEFSFNRQSSLGLIWEYHIRGRCIFQQNELQQVSIVLGISLANYPANHSRCQIFAEMGVSDAVMMLFNCRSLR